VVLTSTGSAERLQRTAGGWKLEFQQLVYNSPSLLRPRRFAVQGEQAILQQLREFSGHEPLARDAERLFGRGALPEGTYVVRDGRWFPELHPDAVAQPELAGLGVDPTTGKSPLDYLTQRIASLESSVRSLQQSLEQALKALASAAVVQRSIAPEPAPVRSKAPGASSLHSGTGRHVQPLAATHSPGQVAEPLEEEEMAAPSESGAKVITLPSISGLSDLVKSLAGPGAVLAPTERFDWKQVGAQQPVFCAVIQDNGGDEAGSMIFDLESALRLAGALLMESDEVVDSLLEEKVMSDEMLDAASEVCNTLTAAFNKVPGNPHLRAGKMQPLSDARSAELNNARKRDDYRYSLGGRLSMIAR
jgi:hypothetical protein